MDTNTTTSLSRMTTAQKKFHNMLVLTRRSSSLDAQMRAAQAGNAALRNFWESTEADGPGACDTALNVYRSAYTQALYATDAR